MTSEERLAYQRQWYHTHKEELREINRERSRQYRETHREEMRAKDRERYHAEREKRAEKARKQRLQPDFKERKSVLMRQYRNKSREQVIQALGGKCSVCGFSDIRALQIDHRIPVRQGGHKRKVITRKRFHEMLAEIETGQHNYQVLCANCHCIKTRTNGEDHPHRIYEE
jgi:5-methylcytosine-specific restriction endonuclease McrA